MVFDSSQPLDFKVRPMRRQEADLVMSWAEAEGWNPGREDAELFFAADPQGFFIGEITTKSGAHAVSCISVVNYGDDFAFLGLYIVRPDYRGHGYGRATWAVAIAHAAERNIGLDGVVAQQAVYKSCGFKLAYRHISYELSEAARVQHLSDTLAGPQIVALSSLPLSQVDAFDRIVFPVSRTAFLQRWITPKHGVGLALIEEGELVAMGVIRECCHGYKVGPLTAKSPRLAEQLLRELCRRVAHGPVFLDVPEPNPEALALARRWGMQPIFETARMYTRETPALALHEVFGVTTYELG